jgi:hypothetical protein
MAVSDFTSANGKSVRVSVELKSESEVFGRDFVSGGLKDFFSKSKEGYWIVSKCEEAYPSNLASLVREAAKSQLGTYPFVMPETSASHIVVALWEGRPMIGEEKLLSGVVQRLSKSSIVQDAELRKKVRSSDSRIQELLDSAPSKRERFDKVSYDAYRKRMENERALSEKPDVSPPKKHHWWNR